jgi:SNF2 family DNA or RNA helicase
MLAQVPGYQQKNDDLLVPLNLAVARRDLFDVPDEFLPRVDQVVPDVVGGLTLRPYQKLGVQFLMSRPGALLADEPGVAKTIQSALAVSLEGHERVLVCGPLISQGTWCGANGDLWKHLGIEVRSLEGRKEVGPEPLQDPGWVFVHYDILDHWFPFICSTFRPTAIIFDEAGVLKGRITVRTKKCRSLSILSCVKKRLLLSATPISNGLIEFWPLLDIAEPGAWGNSAIDFGVRYCNGVKGPYGWSFEGETHSEELRARLKHVVLRRTRAVVQKHLPKLERRIVDTEISEEMYEQYKRAEHNIRDVLPTLRAGAETIVQITKLCTILAMGKVPGTVRQILDLLERHDRVLAFSWYNETAAAIVKALRSTTREDSVAILGPVSGSMPLKRRLEMAEKLRTVPRKGVFVATTASCEMSLNDLVSASAGVFNDLYWVPGRLIQVEARWHREGQKLPSESVFMRAKGTIDDHMISRLTEKATAIEAANADDVDQVSVLVDALRTGDAAVGDLDALISSFEALNTMPISREVS